MTEMNDEPLSKYESIIEGRKYYSSYLHRVHYLDQVLGRCLAVAGIHGVLDVSQVREYVLQGVPGLIQPWEHQAKLSARKCLTFPRMRKMLQSVVDERELTITQGWYDYAQREEKNGCNISMMIKELNSEKYREEVFHFPVQNAVQVAESTKYFGDEGKSLGDDGRDWADLLLDADPEAVVDILPCEEECNARDINIASMDCCTTDATAVTEDMTCNESGIGCDSLMALEEVNDIDVASLEDEVLQDSKYIVQCKELFKGDGKQKRNMYINPGLGLEWETVKKKDLEEGIRPLKKRKVQNSNDMELW